MALSLPATAVIVGVGYFNLDGELDSACTCVLESGDNLQIDGRLVFVLPTTEHHLLRHHHNRQQLLLLHSSYAMKATPGNACTWIISEIISPTPVQQQNTAKQDLHIIHTYNSTLFCPCALASRWVCRRLETVRKVRSTSKRVLLRDPHHQQQQQQHVRGVLETRDDTQTTGHSIILLLLAEDPHPPAHTGCELSHLRYANTRMYVHTLKATPSSSRGPTLVHAVVLAMHLTLPPPWVVLLCVRVTGEVAGDAAAAAAAVCRGGGVWWYL